MKIIWFLVASLSINFISCYPKIDDLQLPENDLTNIPSYTMPDKCKGLTYCHDKGADYPDEQDVLEALENYGMTNISSTEIHQRLDEGNSRCNGNYSNAKIYYILDENNMTRAVLQSANYYMQTYEISPCYNDGYKNCDDKILTSIHVDSICENQYMSFEFHVFGKSELTVELARAKLPVCCKCRLV